MARGRGDRRLYDGRNLSGVKMWLELRDTEDRMVDQCISPDVVGGRRDRGLHDGRNVSGARMWLEVGTTEEIMVEAMCKE